MIRLDVSPGEDIEHARLIQYGFDELRVVEDLPYAGGIRQATAAFAGTRDVVLVPFGSGLAGQLQMASTGIVPLLAK